MAKGLAQAYSLATDFALDSGISQPSDCVRHQGFASAGVYSVGPANSLPTDVTGKRCEFCFDDEPLVVALACVPGLLLDTLGTPVGDVSSPAKARPIRTIILCKAHSPRRFAVYRQKRSRFLYRAKTPVQPTPPVGSHRLSGPRFRRWRTSTPSSGDGGR